MISIFLAAALTGGAPELPRDLGSGWIGRVRVDAMTDKATAQATLKTPAGHQIAIACDKGSRDIIGVAVSSGHYLGASANYEPVLYRFDQMEPAADLWQVHGDVLQPSKDVATFVERMRNSSKMAVRFLKYDDTEVNLVFDIAGAKRAIDAVQNYCAPSVPPVQ